MSSLSEEIDDILIKVEKEFPIPSINEWHRAMVEKPDANCRYWLGQDLRQLLSSAHVTALRLENGEYSP